MSVCVYMSVTGMHVTMYIFKQAWELSEVPQISEVGQSDIRGKNNISEEGKNPKHVCFS